MAYHINPKTNKPGECRAKTPERCKFFNKKENQPVEHYNTPEEAQQAVEKRLQKTFPQQSLTKPLTHKQKIVKIQETISELGFKDRHKQLETLLHSKDTYKTSTAQEFNDRPNGIKYLFYPNPKTKSIEKIEIIENNSYDYTQEELDKVAEKLNQSLQQN